MPKLIHEWDRDDETLRLVDTENDAREVWFEKLSTDAFGEPYWRRCAVIEPRDGLVDILMSAIRDLAA